LSSVGGLAASSRRGPLERLAGWLDAIPHPEVVCEIARGRVAAARWGPRNLEGFAQAEVEEGVVAPSPVQPNVARPEALAPAVRRVLDEVRGRRHELALLVPDAVVRVFILPFDEFPRRAAEALPFLRWRLKKSIPFDVEETVVSWMRQRSAEGRLEIVTAVARQSILREYEAAVAAAGMAPGVVLSSTLATLPLVAAGQTIVLVRASGTWLVTAILAGERLAVYRCTEMGADPARSEPQALLDEIYPAVAYYQDTARAGVDQVRLAGLAARFEEFRPLVERELGCRVTRLEAGPFEDLPEGAMSLFRQQLDSLAGWRLNRGA
jgi:type IV pilus assembly protein PilM